ncbi:MAG TPA: CCA tRNA nucleotidyltransferase [Mycobacteriales bacterium]|nr:CCA tRNA nucleotidyltransferase [Mycobacteriales bacterium]
MSRLTDAQRSAVTELLRIAPVADDLGRRFAAAGHRLYLVGGSVRDALLGRLGDDLDFATDARPEQVLALVEPWGSTWETGRAFGTIGVARGDVRCEITTFRAESYDPESRKPEVVYGDSLDGDLVRRDFTVNAMAVALPDHEFVDPYGGLRDLAEGVLRTPGAPEDSFGDDPLRMLRAARFAAQLGFTPAPEVVAAMAAMAERLTIVSAERIQGELSKLLLGASPVRGLTLLVDTGLAEIVLPELPAMRLAIDAVHQHKDVYLHSLAVLENAIAREDAGPDLTLRMAALLHDIGKPATREIGPDGVSFHHHEVVGAKLARKRLRALKYPKQFTEDVCRLIELHLRFHTFRMGWTDSAVRRYVTDAGDLLDRLHKLVRSDCTTRNRAKAERLAASYDSLERRIVELAKAEELKAIRPDLDGREIMELLGLPPGPAVGRAYRYLLDQRMERGPIPHDEAVALLREWASTNL